MFTSSTATTTTSRSGLPIEETLEKQLQDAASRSLSKILSSIENMAATLKDWSSANIGSEAMFRKSSSTPASSSLTTFTTRLLKDDKKMGAMFALVATYALARLSWAVSAHWRRSRNAKRAQARNYSVAIIGGGVGGIQMAKQCLDLGLPFHIYEMADEYGGTWLYNKYPGSGCDVASHAYSFSWAPKADWTRKWSRRDEILAYFKDVARNKLGLEPHTSFLTKVRSATYRDGLWTVEVENVRSGAVSTHEHAFLVSSVGQLNVPTYPEEIIHTKDRFKGEQFHSARWPDAIDLRGKRVACVGTGASAIQFAPEVAKECKELIILQRTPGWIVEKHDYAYPQWAKTLFSWCPPARLAYRYYLLLFAELLYLSAIRNSGPKPSKYNLILQGAIQAQMTKGSPAKLHPLVVPKERLGCKRILQSDGWLQMLHRPNVQLLSDAVAEITPTGIRCVSGATHEVDVIIYGTGFETGSFLKGIEIKFEDPVTKQMKDLKTDIWRGYPRVYHGVTVGGVPNFAMTYGPNHNVNHTSIISITECESSHIAELLSTVVSSGLESFTCKPEAWEKYNDREQELLKSTAFSAECNSWYTRNEFRRILNNWHGSLTEMWLTTSSIKPGDYIFQ